MKTRDSLSKGFLVFGETMLYWKVFLPAEGMATGIGFLLDWRDWLDRFFEDPAVSFLKLILGLLAILALVFTVYLITFLIGSALQFVGILPTEVMQFITAPLR